MRTYYLNRILTFIVTFFSVVSIAYAGTRSVEQARAAAMQQIRKDLYLKTKGNGTSAYGTPRLVFSKIKKTADSEKVYYYVFSTGNDCGYTLVSGDDRMPAIIGYTQSGNYDEDKMPDNFRNFMQAYQDMIDNATDLQLSEIAEWQSQRTVHSAVAPIMGEKWNQSEPYNNLCPLISNRRAVTGCVATAVAQILHHNSKKSLITLTDEIPAYTTKTNNILMPAINAGYNYNWNDMSDVYTGTESTAQKNAVAELMLHVGCAVQMDYSPDASGANANATTFVKYFGMDPELIRQPQRENYEFAEWDEILYGEMATGRPVYYDGQSTGGGHAFVIHGYADGLYYVNWGWGGYCDGYFDITILNPQSTAGTGASSSDDGYGMYNSMIIGIQPDNGIVDKLPSSAFSCYEFGNDRVSNISMSGSTLTAKASVRVYNLNPKEYTRYVGVGYMDDNGNIKKVGSTPRAITIDGFPVSGGYYVYTIEFGISFTASNGKTYELFAIESTDNKNWIAMDGKTWNASIKIDNGKATLIGKSSTLSATASLNENSSGYTGMNNTIDISISNSGNKEYYDIVYVMASTSDAMPSGYTFAQGITATTGSNTTFKFSYIPPVAGIYNFWILDADGRQIGKSRITFKESTAPVLSFVSIKCTNASEEKVYAEFQGKNIEMYKVNDTKADITFEIRNDGGYYEGEFILYNKLDASTGGFSGYYTTLSIPGYTTTKFTFTVEGNAGDVVGCMLKGYAYDIADLTNPNTHPIKNGFSYYSFKDCEICYLAGVPSGIESPITYNGDNVKLQDIYNINGQRIKTPRKGINIINGRKVILK